MSKTPQADSRLPRHYKTILICLHCRFKGVVFIPLKAHEEAAIYVACPNCESVYTIHLSKEKKK